MGLLNTNATYLGNNITFPVVEGYCGSIGAAMASIDGQYNDFAMFEAALYSDFAEAGALREGAELLPLQEASISGFFGKIVEFFKKLGAKINSLFQAFIAKMQSWFQKDTKAFVKKWRPVIVAKTDFNKMKAKYSEPTKEAPEYPTIEIASTGGLVKEDDSAEEGAENILGNILGSSSCTRKEFSKELHDHMYDSEEVKDDWTKSEIVSILNNLEGGDKMLSELKKKNDSIQNNIKKTITYLTKQQAEVSKKYPKGDAGTDLSGDENIDKITIDGDKFTTVGNTTVGTKAGSVDKLQKRLAYFQVQASAHQAAMTTYASAVMNESKFAMTQARRIVATAVAYTPVKEDAMMIDAYAECEQMYCEEAFDAMEVVA